LIRRHLKEVYGTIKLIDIEERFDIYFSRFFGLFFAKIGRYLSLTPTHVSIMSLVTGVIGGALLYFQQDLEITLLAGFLISLAGVLDSADGQLARMTGQSTDLGRMIDGIIDNFVFISCYVGATAYWVFNTDQDVLMIALAALSGYFFSLKAALYEFYKTEYLQLVAKQIHGNVPLSLSDFKVEGDSLFHRFVYYVIYDYTRKQLQFSTRTQAFRARIQQLSKASDNSAFDRIYRELNRPMMFWWAIFCGANTHRTLIIVSSVFGRFDLYLIASICWTVFIIPVSLMQKRADQKLNEAFAE
jgi:phosphatidylglycerophosphate synthase